MPLMIRIQPVNPTTVLEITPEWRLALDILAILSLCVTFLVAWAIWRLAHERAQRQQIEAGLQEREGRLRLVEDQVTQLSRAVEQSPTSIVITDRLGNIIYVNPKFTDVTGYAREEVIGQNSRILKTEFTRSGTHAALWRTILDGHEWRGEFCNRKKDGSLYWEFASISPILDASGTITHFVAVKEDITEQKRMQEALRTSEELYRHMFLKHAAIKLLIDPETGQIVDANEAAVQFYGYSLETLRTMQMHQLNGLPAEAAIQLLQSVAAGVQRYYVLAHRLASGEVRDVEVYAMPIQSGGRMVLYSIIHDITARRKAEQSLQDANEELRARIAQIESLQEALREQAIRDPLTSLYNRRYLYEALPREASRAWRGGYPISIVVLDIDHFKSLNDTYGHAAGDKALQVLAQQLQHLTRGSDVVCRYGGEEFLVVMVNATSEAAYERAEQWRQNIESLRFTYADALLQFTISGGVASFPQDSNMLEEVIRLADEALYQAKAAGRNRIVRQLSVPQQA